MKAHFFPKAPGSSTPFKTVSLGEVLERLGRKTQSCCVGRCPPGGGLWAQLWEGPLCQAQDVRWGLQHISPDPQARTQGVSGRVRRGREEKQARTPARRGWDAQPRVSDKHTVSALAAGVRAPFFFI